MERADLDRIQEQFERGVRKRLPGAPIARVVVLQYGDDPEIEPGELMGRVYIEAPSDREQRDRFFEAFREQYGGAIKHVRHDLDQSPIAGMIEFVVGDGDDRRAFRLGRRRGALSETTGVPLVPVMARLGLTEIETVDTLITAGIAVNRAEAIRWALGRIRERPAYEELQRRAREIEELKQQF